MLRNCLRPALMAWLLIHGSLPSVWAQSKTTQAETTQTQNIASLMPEPSDHTSMWWQGGFPGIIDGARWTRVVRTGKYQFALDTNKMRILHLGAVAAEKVGSADLKLTVQVDGKTYVCKQGAPWSKYAGPRLIESGNFLQRSDVNGLVFTAADGSKLNADGRFETAAWADQLAMTLAVRPGISAFRNGEESPGRVTGGFGLNGENQLNIAANDCHTPKAFTLCFWAFTPTNFKAGPHAPWLVCKNSNETQDGNYGIMLDHDAVASVRLNIGGGRENAATFKSQRNHALRRNQWNHLSLSYDGDSVCLVVNGSTAISERIGKSRDAPRGGLTIGGRQDGLAGFAFRGVVDEVFLFDRALTQNETRLLYRKPEKNHDAQLQPRKRWAFRDTLPPMTDLPRAKWKNAIIQIAVGNHQSEARSKASSQNGARKADSWQLVTVTIDPLTMKPIEPNNVAVAAVEMATNQERPVVFDPHVGWHRVNLDSIKPIRPKGIAAPSNDSIERIRLRLSNPTARKQTARLMFEKTSGGIRQRIGQTITGISAILRDSQGQPTGIPVQLSKNWHSHPDAGVYSGMWFHGISQVQLAPKQTTELELTIAYGHWGGVAAASHAQLSLIGWGTNQLWDQSALGSWGESICYNPEQALGACTVTDVRPLMVKPMNGRDDKWNWTQNVGGADFFRLFDAKGKRVFHSAMRADYRRTGPCLTEVRYSGRIGETGIAHHITTSIARTDDLVRATYRVRMDVTKPIDFSRFVIFQTGADTYAYTQAKKLAIGDQTGLIAQWGARLGGNTYRGDPVQFVGPNPWASLHATIGEPNKPQLTGWANRGVVIRKWNARMGGKQARPWMAERGTDIGSRGVSTIDIVPPPSVTKLQPGDFVDATIEFVVMPQFAAEYYGPNQSFRLALSKNENSWQMIYREALRGAFRVDARVGKLQQLYPGVTINTENDKADFDLHGGLGYVPITLTNLSSHAGYVLKVNGKPLDQSVHGNDFWQTNYDAQTKRWSQTFNVPADQAKPITFQFAPGQQP